MSGADAPIRAVHLSKRYGRASWALREVDLAVPAGAITALVGPNGAGKSTLIRTCVGFERPTAGQARVAGVDPWRRRSEAIRHIGYVPQGTSLYGSLSVADHLDLAASLRRGFDREQAARRLEELEIPLGRRVDQCSGGQQAQVSLALALGTRADVYLLDEPLAALDPLARRDFLSVFVAAVHEDGATAVLSSHIITDIEAACDRIVVLDHGRILLDDALADAVGRFSVAPADGQADPPPVATFRDPTGTWCSLYERAGAPSGARHATLEEVVLGHLAASRKVHLREGRDATRRGGSGLFGKRNA